MATDFGGQREPKPFIADQLWRAFALVVFYYKYYLRLMENSNRVLLYRVADFGRNAFP